MLARVLAVAARPGACAGRRAAVRWAPVQNLGERAATVRAGADTARRRRRRLAEPGGRPDPPAHAGGVAAGGHASPAPR